MGKQMDTGINELLKRNYQTLIQIIYSQSIVKIKFDDSLEVQLLYNKDSVTNRLLHSQRNV